MQNIKEKLIETAKNYESSTMMRNDSEVEIAVLRDIENPGVYLCDYSKERGSAEHVEKICDIGEITKDAIIAACHENHWAYSGL